jgi:hypothetical protein
VAAQFRKDTTQFRLKKHNESDGKKDGDALKKPVDDLQFEKLGNEGKAQQQDEQAGKNARAARGPEKEVTTISQRGEDDNLHAIAPMLCDKVPHGVSAQSVTKG